MKHNHEYLLIKVDPFGMKNGDYRFTFKNLDLNEIITCYTGPRKQIEYMTSLHGKKKKTVGYKNFESNGWKTVYENGVGHVYTFAPKMFNPMKHQHVTRDSQLPNFETRFESTSKGQVEQLDGDSIIIHVRKEQPKQEVKQPEYNVVVEDGLFTWET
tara:strand:+ start:823 stop:1293 length:471 start_codon:yes stop_codon:yes gene_type:complete